ncbi:hypothetical protein [Rhodococcus globerulus]|uniref:Uncharacterized protein n=1 Tax=Rhodococcus globerulus TaxID=33008 RepID=A0ABU4C5G3_RHOGO|nr:hypothetical protein [Rhodococcus globerulus]MDV6271654.1 hypothetical protein [Rhodococcus globerulus]
MNDTTAGSRNSGFRSASTGGVAPGDQRHASSDREFGTVRRTRNDYRPPGIRNSNSRADNNDEQPHCRAAVDTSSDNVAVSRADDTGTCASGRVDDDTDHIANDDDNNNNNNNNKIGLDR